MILALYILVKHPWCLIRDRVNQPKAIGYPQTAQSDLANKKALS